MIRAKKNKQTKEERKKDNKETKIKSWQSSRNEGSERECAVTG